ncbi:HNH endonuclease, partial [Corynebacterium diphtheriae]
MNTTGETTQPFYSHCDMNDPLCRAERLRIQFDYYRWHSLQPDDNDDVDTYTADIATRIGKTQRYVCDHLDAIYYLTQLPQLHALYQQLWHLDDTRLITITRIISALPTTYYDAIDTHLTRWLTPTQPAQTIPSTRAITRFLRKTITHLGF